MSSHNTPNILRAIPLKISTFSKAQVAMINGFKNQSKFNNLSGDISTHVRSFLDEVTNYSKETTEQDPKVTIQEDCVYVPVDLLKYLNDLVFAVESKKEDSGEELSEVDMLIFCWAGLVMIVSAQIELRRDNAQSITKSP